MGTDMIAYIQDTPTAPLESEPCFRNYHAYALLANVRNGGGSAGVVTGPAWPSLPPRGIPPELSVDKTGTQVWLGNNAPPSGWEYDPHAELGTAEPPRPIGFLGLHSHSWATLVDLQELLAQAQYRFPDGYPQIGVVDRANYAPGKAPKSFCASVVGKGVRIVAEDELEHASDYTHVRASWLVPIEKAAPLLFDLIASLEKRFATARLVFGFC